MSFQVRLKTHLEARPTAKIWRAGSKQEGPDGFQPGVAVSRFRAQGTRSESSETDTAQQPAQAKDSVLAAKSVTEEPKEG